MSWRSAGLVVVPIDFSGEGIAAIETALALTGSPASVRVVHVLHPVDVVSPGMFYADFDDENRALAVRELFAQIVAGHALEPHWAELSLDVRFGSPGVEVPRYADEVNAGLIVIPSHGYAGVTRFLIGSVAERIIRHAHCDVLVLRRGDAQ